MKPTITESEAQNANNQKSHEQFISLHELVFGQKGSELLIKLKLPGTGKKQDADEYEDCRISGCSSHPQKPHFLTFRHAFSIRNAARMN